MNPIVYTPICLILVLLGSVGAIVSISPNPDIPINKTLRRMSVLAIGIGIVSFLVILEMSLEYLKGMITP